MLRVDVPEATAEEQSYNVTQKHALGLLIAVLLLLNFGPLSSPIISLLMKILMTTFLGTSENQINNLSLSLQHTSYNHTRKQFD